MQENIKNQNLKQVLQSSIEITISDPEIRFEYAGTKQYHIYNIKGKDAKGIFQIQRRFSDFQLLRLTLTKRWPGCFISSLPAKLKISNSDEEFLQIRSKYLQKFLQQISKKEYLWYSEEVQFFVKINTMNCEKVLGAFSKIDFKQLSYRYSVTFKHLLEKDQQKSKGNISQFQKQLAQNYLKIQQLRNKAQEIFNAQAKYQRKYLKLMNGLTIYQKKVRSHYVQDQKSQNIEIISSKQNRVLKDIFQQCLNDTSFKLLFEELKRQKRQIFAVQQSLKIRSEYFKQKQKLEGKIQEHENKIEELKNGKQSLMSKIRNKTTDTDIQGHQKSITKYKEQLNVVAQLCSLINSIVTIQEIQSFKKERRSSYYQMVREIIKLENILSNRQNQFWSSIGKMKICDFQIQEISQVQGSKDKLVQEINTSNDNKEEIQNFLKDEEHEQQVQVQDRKVEKQDQKLQLKQIQRKHDQKQEDVEKLSPQIQSKQTQKANQKQSMNQQTNNQQINESQTIQESTEHQGNQQTENQHLKNEECETLKVKSSQDNLASPELKTQTGEQQKIQKSDAKKKVVIAHEEIKQQEKGEENIEPQQVINSK